MYFSFSVIFSFLAIFQVLQWACLIFHVLVKNETCPLKDKEYGEKKEKIVPDDIKEVKEQIYAVLSNGIHEYDEKECIELFPAVQFIIERILDETIYEADKKRKAQEAKLTIQNQLKKCDNN